MGRLIFLSLTLISSFSYALSYRARQSSLTLLGPEVIPFCGGLVEAYVRVDRGIQLVIRATPPEGAEWEITNGHILASHPENPDKPLQFSSLEILKVRRGETSSRIWRFNDLTLDSWADRLNVGFLPFTGCQAGQKPVGVVLQKTDN
jgi:hypothetical protein